MLKVRNIFLLFYCLACYQITWSQNKSKNNVLDSAFTIPMITANYGMQWPGADMKETFGMNSQLGGTFAIKNKKQWFYGITGNFLWGRNVNKTDILNHLKTSEGYIIDNEGRLTQIYFEERGSSFFLIGGKVFNVLTQNNNSGILVYGGVGTLHHKIRIAFKDDINLLTEEYKKGYDRLSFGYALNAFIGYMHLSKNRFLNFYGGFDFTQGWTNNLRKFNYDTRQEDTKTYSDMLYGFKVGWIIRLNKRTQQEYYYD